MKLGGLAVSGSGRENLLRLRATSLRPRSVRKFMKHIFFFAAFLALFASGERGRSAPVGRSFVAQATVGPYRGVELVQEFKGGERACVIVSGNGLSYLGLYVYDANGNCIARDDHGNYATRDDAAVEWYPSRAGRYAIEVKNLGTREDAFKMAVQ